MRSTSGARHTRLPALLLALALIAGLATKGGAQHAAQAAAGARHVSRPAPERPTGDLRLLSRTAATDSARRSAAPFLMGGALAGAVVGGLLAASFHDSFCGDAAPGYTCSSTSPAAGALIGAGVGVIAGWILWTFTKPADSPPRVGSG